MNHITLGGAIVGVIGLLFVGLSLLVTKEAANDAHESSIAAGRAWVGPVDTGISAVPTSVEQEILSTVGVRNTGKQPALDFTWDITPNVINPDTDTNFDAEITGYVKNCLVQKPREQNQVVYPTTGLGTGFEFSNSFKKEEIDWDVIYGVKILVVRGCFFYNNGYGIGHSAFCYFYRAGKTKDPKHLNICEGGSAAN